MNEQKSQLNYIYGRASAERITGRKVKETVIFDNCILIKFEEGSPMFFSRKNFKKHFAAWRKEKGKSVAVEFDYFTGLFSAISERNFMDRYTLDLFPERITCNCKDQETQKEIGIKTPMCKHSYAVLNYLGFSSLEEYIEKDGMSFLDHCEQWNVNQDLRDYHNGGLAVSIW